MVERSLIISKGAIERGLFDGCKFTYEKTELEQKEEMGNPDASKTEGIKSANYGKLVNGIVQPGTHIGEGDVLIGKYMSVPKSQTSKFAFTDRSIIYKDSEPAIVQTVIIDRNEDAMRFAKVGMRKIRTLCVGDKLCITDDHEVMTNKGWKNITEIDEKDIIATLNPNTHNLEWNNPTNVYNFDHEGEMYELNNNLVSIKSTMNHKMYVKTTSNGIFRLVEADKLTGIKYWNKRNCINPIPDKKYFKLPKIVLPWKQTTKTYSEKNYKMNSWLTFLGVYLAEGCVDKERSVRLSVHKPRVREKMEELLEEMDIEYVSYVGEENYFYIRSHQISNYMKQFGISNDKFIPEWCRKLGKGNAYALLTGLILGDGCYNKKKNSWEYYSNSKQLADDVQCLAILCELSATIVVKNKKSEVLKIKGITTQRTHDHYRVYITNYKNCMEPACDYRSYEETIEEKFNGKVYCIEVPNHIFMVRRNDKYCWTGNSSRAG
jgi:replicative DNA helicase Mcm